MAMTPAERRLRAQVAANTMWAKTDDRAARTAKARSKSPFCVEYWVEQTDPALSAAERQRRGESLFKANQARLALKAAQARRRKKAS